MRTRLLLTLVVALILIFNAGFSDVLQKKDNIAPEITSPIMTEASGGIYYIYRAVVLDSDSPASSVRFSSYPSWLTPDNDSLFGTPPDALGDTSFLLIASDGSRADTALIQIKMNPAIIVFGDTRTGHNIHRQIVNLITQTKPSAVFHTGDLVSDGRFKSDWDTFNVIAAPILAHSEFYPALGNHEHQSKLYFDNFTLPGNEQWYSVEKNRTHFIILNSCITITPESEQYKWLVNDLSGIGDSIRFVVALFHHPPYSTGEHDEDEMGLRATLVPLLEKYGVDMIFNGHDHDYERSLCGGRYYIVAGGGGAPLRDQARTSPCSQLYLKKYHFCKLSMVDGRLIVKVYDNRAHLIDHYEIQADTPNLRQRQSEN
jgi:Calcineurin-like phosphoesterase